VGRDDDEDAGQAEDQGEEDEGDGGDDGVLDCGDDGFDDWEGGLVFGFCVCM